MVIVFIKAMQVVRGAWVLLALEPSALAAPSLPVTRVACATGIRKSLNTL
jgi:hypothetical protein